MHLPVLVLLDLPLPLLVFLPLLWQLLFCPPLTLQLQQRLLGELQIWLVSRQLGAEQIVWTLEDHGSTATAELKIRFARAQQRREAFLDITRLKLESAQLPCLKKRRLGQE